MSSEQPRAEEPGRVVRLARELRDEYIRRRREHVPGYYNVGSNFGDAFFLRVAAFLADTGNPSAKAYVATAFDVYGPDCKTNMLAATKLKEAYAARYASYDRELAEEFTTMQRLFTQHLKAGRGPREVLVDETLYFPPAFRYIAALRCGLNDVAERFANQAAEAFDAQVVLQRLYPQEFERCMNQLSNRA